MLSTLNALKVTIGKKEGELKVTVGLLQKCETSKHEVRQTPNKSSTARTSRNF